MNLEESLVCNGKNQTMDVKSTTQKAGNKAAGFQPLIHQCQMPCFCEWFHGRQRKQGGKSRAFEIGRAHV